jgi:hypothetical protein
MVRMKIVLAQNREGGDLATACAGCTEPMQGASSALRGQMALDSVLSSGQLFHLFK